MPSDLYKQGENIRREVMGESHVSNATKKQDNFDQDIQKLVTEFAWGEVWGKTTLTRKQKSLNNLCILAALNRPDQFKGHIRGAINNGCSVEEIKETLLQVAAYCGLPAGLASFALAREVLTELDLL